MFIEPGHSLINFAAAALAGAFGADGAGRVGEVAAQHRIAQRRLGGDRKGGKSEECAGDADVRMPGMSGIELLGEVMKVLLRYPTIPRNLLQGSLADQVLPLPSIGPELAQQVVA